MKKLFILVFFSITFFTNAQDTKPTKQETIDYITNYILKADSKLLSYVIAETQSYRQTALITIEEFTVNGTVLRIKSSYKTHYVNWARDIDTYENQNVFDYEIDLAKVDFLTVGNYLNRNGSASNCSYISFHLKGDGPTTYKATVEVVGQIDFESQIVKAFNHLRKLCGAPEPIKF